MSSKCSNALKTSLIFFHAEGDYSFIREGNFFLIIKAECFLILNECLFSTMNSLKLRVSLAISVVKRNTIGKLTANYGAVLNHTFR